jgi:coenzyme F420-reducing hydrogenase gamma subunit
MQWPQNHQARKLEMRVRRIRKKSVILIAWTGCASAAKDPGII